MRPSYDIYFMSLALLASKRGSCARREVGCVLVNKSNRVISTGYNGPLSGIQNCIDVPCPGASQPSGQSLDLCMAIHAEQNAMLTCDTKDIYTAYCTALPCIQCSKMLANTPCVRIAYLTEYPHGIGFWEKMGRQITKIQEEDVRAFLSSI